MGQFAKAVDYVNANIGPDTFPDWEAKSFRKDYPHIPTGALVFDAMSGIGGFPRGMITELFGPESCGKTTLALECGRECQTECKQAVLYLDYAHDFDPKWAKNLSVNLGKDWFALEQPATLEDGLRVAEYMMLKSGGELGLVIVDDVASMNPAMNAEREIGENLPAARARILSEALCMLRDRIAKTQVAWVFINQLREIIESGWKPPGVKAAEDAQAKRSGSFGVKKQSTPGGRALKFYAGMRVEFKPQVIERKEVESILTGKTVWEMTGQKSKFQIVKNKCFRPYTEGELFQRVGTGYDSITSCIEVAANAGLIKETKGVYKVPQPYCGKDMLEKTFSSREALWYHLSNSAESLEPMVAHVTQVLQTYLEIK